MPPGLRTSVIICTMDRPDDLGRALQSLQSQTLLPDEVIIVDASRNDRSEAPIPEAFQSLPIRYFHTRTPGLTRQRNIGIRESTGDVLLFLDDDVILEPEYIEHVAAAFARDTEGKISPFWVGSQTSSR